MAILQEAPSDIKIADTKGRVTLGARFAGKRFSIREEADGTAILTPVVILPESESLITQSSLAQKLTFLEELADNWDGYGSPAPTAEVIIYAREALAMLHAGALARGIVWTEPHISCNERGQVTLEWWKGSRTLTLYVRSGNELDYLKAWGSNIENDMEDGPVGGIADFIALSRWLNGSEITKV